METQTVPVVLMENNNIRVERSNSTTSSNASLASSTDSEVVTRTFARILNSYTKRTQDGVLGDLEMSRVEPTWCVWLERVIILLIFAYECTFLVVCLQGLSDCKIDSRIPVAGAVFAGSLVLTQGLIIISHFESSNFVEIFKVVSSLFVIAALITDCVFVYPAWSTYTTSNFDDSLYCADIVVKFSFWTSTIGLSLIGLAVFSLFICASYAFLALFYDQLVITILTIVFGLMDNRKENNMREDV